MDEWTERDRQDRWTLSGQKDGFGGPARQMEHKAIRTSLECSFSFHKQTPRKWRCRVGPEEPCRGLRTGEKTCILEKPSGQEPWH